MGCRGATGGVVRAPRVRGTAGPVRRREERRGARGCVNHTAGPEARGAKFGRAGRRRARTWKEALNVSDRTVAFAVVASPRGASATVLWRCMLGKEWQAIAVSPLRVRHHCITMHPEDIAPPTYAAEPRDLRQVCDCGVPVRKADVQSAGAAVENFMRLPQTRDAEAVAPDEVYDQYILSFANPQPSRAVSPYESFHLVN